MNEVGFKSYSYIDDKGRHVLCTQDEYAEHGKMYFIDPSNLRYEPKVDTRPLYRKFISEVKSRLWNAWYALRGLND